MRNWLRRSGRARSVRSGLGWPVPAADFASLPAAKGKARDQLLHWMAWEAYRGRPKE